MAAIHEETMCLRNAYPLDFTRCAGHVTGTSLVVAKRYVGMPATVIFEGNHPFLFYAISAAKDKQITTN